MAKKIILINFVFLFITGCINNTNEVEIGKQIWMSENLNVERFRNGDLIPQAKTDEEWETAGENGEPAWCYYNNDSKMGKKYGKLYNWYAVYDSRGLAPKGWRIPSDRDWSELVEYLGKDNAGLKMKSTNNWKDNGNGTNESGFSGFPGGYRYYDGLFAGHTIGGGWWSSTLSIKDSDIAICHILNNNAEHLRKHRCGLYDGNSVRCIKN